MPDYYFEVLNHHIISINLREPELRKLWQKYLAQTKMPDFTMWCVFLAQAGITFFYYATTKPETFVRID